MMATGSGVRSCVPPRSASTGSGGGGTSSARGDHASGDGIRVRLRGMGLQKLRLRLALGGAGEDAPLLGFAQGKLAAGAAALHSAVRISFRTSKIHSPASIVHGRARWPRETSR